MRWRVAEGDCVEQMAQMPDASVDAIVTDPPYGLEFMGKQWDKLGEDSWRIVGGFSKPGLGERPTSWPSFAGRDNANATCATCGGRMRGAKKCTCEEPDWRVKGRALAPTGGASFSEDGMGKGFKALPSFNGSPNPSCRNCGGTLRGQDRRGFHRCACDTPDFPDTRGNQARAMQDWHERWAREALRVLKPGGHLLAAGGSRTYHRLTCAIEDAGFEVRDCITHLYGSGFPKSLDVSKAIDKQARGVPQGAADPTSPNHGQYRTQATEGKRDADDQGRGYGAGPGQFMLKPGDTDPRTGRKVVGLRTKAGMGSDTTFAQDAWTQANRGPVELPVTEPATPEAEQWQGWGTALKPAAEFWVLARKPLAGNVADNVLKHGTGALNIDACRIQGTDEIHVPQSDPAKRSGVVGTDLGISAADPESFQEAQRESVERANELGRWPANVCFSHSRDCKLVGTRAVRTGTAVRHRSGGNTFGGENPKPPMEDIGYADEDGMETVEDWQCAEDCPVRLLDEQTGVLKSGEGAVRHASGADHDGNTGAAYGAESRPAGTPMLSYGDEGGASRFYATFPHGREGEPSAHRRYTDNGATKFSLTPGLRRDDKGGTSRFFYTAKASRAERDAGLDGFAPGQGALRNVKGRPMNPRCATSGKRVQDCDCEPTCDWERPIETARNIHPTVKPIDLMRWLVRLVTPPDGLVLDCFMGSGTTGIACLLEGFRFHGIERDPEYVKIARARIEHWARYPAGTATDDALDAAIAERRIADSGQLAMFE